MLTETGWQEVQLQVRVWCWRLCLWIDFRVSEVRSLMFCVTSIVISQRTQTKNGESISSHFLFLSGSIVLFLWSLFVQKAIDTVFDQLKHMACTTAGPDWNSRLFWLKVTCSQGNWPFSTLGRDSASPKHHSASPALICPHGLESVYPHLPLLLLLWP